MVHYDLSHLTQDSTENVIGPIQDTEALLLYSIVRGMRMRRILEIGGLSGYSARNFLQAFAEPSKSILYTVDLNVVPVLAENHKVLVKDAGQLSPEDLGHEPLDLVFFDCHCLDAQVNLYNRLLQQGLITDRTVLALHDTNTHPYKVVPGYQVADGTWVHQQVERVMVNLFVEQKGYHAFSLHTTPDRHDLNMPFRHGVTLLQKFQALAV